MAFEKFREYLRILQLARKPTGEEFSRVAKVSGAGILIVGGVGFIIYLVMVVLPGRF